MVTGSNYNQVKWNRCDICGKFIAMKDFDSGFAIRYMVTPDSEYSTEDYETLCREHIYKYTEKDMNKTLETIARLCEKGGAMTTTPIKPHIQAEIDAGNVKTIKLRSGPLGIYTGEVELELTDAGRNKIKVEIQ